MWSSRSWTITRSEKAALLCPSLVTQTAATLAWRCTFLLSIYGPPISSLDLLRFFLGQISIGRLLDASVLRLLMPSLQKFTKKVHPTRGGV